MPRILCLAIVSVLTAATSHAQNTATITGKLTRASQPISGTLYLYRSDGVQWTNASSSIADGSFTLTTTRADTYYVVGKAAGALPKVFGGVTCPTQDIAECPIHQGTPLSLVIGGSIANVDINLDAPAAISGTVSLARNGSRPEFLKVAIYSGSTSIATVNTLGDGRYSFTDVAPGRYVIRTVADVPVGVSVWPQNGQQDTTAGPLIDAWYGDACVACAGARPTPIVVTAGAALTGIDIHLDDNGGNITGVASIRGITSGAFEMPRIDVYSSTGTLVRSVTNGTFGDFGFPWTANSFTWTARGLPAGTYYVRTFSPAKPFFISHITSGGAGGVFVEQLFDRITCIAADCSPLRGTPVTVTARSTTPGVDFTLDYGAQISGKGMGVFLGTSVVDVYDSRGVLLPGRSSAYPVDNRYVVFGLPAGTYYLVHRRVLSGLNGSIAPFTAYKDMPCDGCAVTTGTPVTVTLGENKTGIDFTPPASGAVAGTVRTDAAAPLGAVTIDAFAPNASVVASVNSADDGTYRIDGLAAGQYFLRSRNLRGYVDERFDNLACGGCDPRSGTSVPVAAGVETANINFSLASGQTVSGNVRATDGAPLAGVGVVFFTISFDRPQAARALTNSEGAFTTTLAAGAYFAQTEPLDGYAQRMYNNWPCPQGQCSSSGATPIAVSGSAVSGIDFALPACTGTVITPVHLAEAAVGTSYRQVLFATGGTGLIQFAISSGALPSGLALDARSGVLSGTPTSAGRFTFSVSAIDGAGCAGSRSYTLDVPPCTISPPVLPVLPVFPAFPFPVSFTTTCATWTVSSDADWLTVARAPSGSAFTIYAPMNQSDLPRSGTIHLGSLTLTVVQLGNVDAAPFGMVDTPASGAVVAGSIPIGGWALDDVGVTNVAIYRDPVGTEGPGQVFIGNATFIEGARPDVERAYPALPARTRAGWGYLLLTNMLPGAGNGVFNLSAYAVDNHGQRTHLGTRTITAVNATATAPFGAIDTPDQGGVVSGASYVNFGWALTPQPKMIPIDGSTIRVIVDGVPLGTVSGYNLFRTDVSSLFQGRKNSSGPVGYRVLDTTALGEGLHNIAWTVTDDAGVTTGIGSRYFTVRNSAWTPSIAASRLMPPALTRAEVAQVDATTAVPPRVDGIDSGRKTASLNDLPASEASGPRANPRTIEIDALERLELRLTSDTDGCGATFDGYLSAGGELRPLPVGSSLDRSGTFYWYPGPAFRGSYSLIFVRTTCDGAREMLPVTVKIAER